MCIHLRCPSSLCIDIITFILNFVFSMTSQKTVCSDAFDFLFDETNLNPEKVLQLQNGVIYTLYKFSLCIYLFHSLKYSYSLHSLILYFFSLYLFLSFSISLRHKIHYLSLYIYLHIINCLLIYLSIYPQSIYIHTSITVSLSFSHFLYLSICFIFQITLLGHPLCVRQRDRREGSGEQTGCTNQQWLLYHIIVRAVALYML